jgi:hypothetical protein
VTRRKKMTKRRRKAPRKRAVQRTKRHDACSSGLHSLRKINEAMRVDKAQKHQPEHRSVAPTQPQIMKLDELNVKN